MTLLTSLKSSRSAALIYIFCSLILIFCVPTLVPGSFVDSDSYVFGYNNRVGFLLFVSLTAIGSLWFRHFRIEPPEEASNPQVPRKSLWIALVVAFCICILLYELTARWGQFRDSTEMINRIELASRGLIPYRDFEFHCGVSYLYIPLLLKLLLHLSIPDAYYLFWVLTVLVSTWMLYELVNRVDLPSEHKGTIFGLLFFATIHGVLTTGANYSAFRFLTAPLFALIVYHTVLSGSYRSKVQGSYQAVFLALVLLLISPESAVAFCIGVTTFLFLFYIHSRQRRWLVSYMCMLLSLLLLLLVANHLGLFLYLKYAAAGAKNLPLIPAPHILLLFGAVYMCSCFVAHELLARDWRSNSLLLLFVSFPSLAAAMGCCEPMHVVFNAMGIFLVSMLIVSNNAVAWNWYRFLFAVVFLVFDGIGGQLVYFNPISHALSALSNSQSTPDLTRDPVVLPAGLTGPALIPFGYPPSHNPTGLDGGYFFGTLNAFTPAAVETKVSELARQPTEELLLPKDYEKICLTDPDSRRLFISISFAYPFSWKAKHTESIYAPLCDYIGRNYYLKVAPQPKTFGYGIWARK